MLRLADLLPEVSLEIADNFIVDFSADDDIAGLEILWDDADRAGSEPALLAFGIFSAAVVWLGYHYVEHAGAKARWAVLRKTKDFIAATDLRLQVTASGPANLIIADGNGKPLLCADFRYYPRHILKPGRAPKTGEQPTPLATQLDEMRSAIDGLSRIILPYNPGAVGVAVFIDAIGNLRYHQPIDPGCWITWPEMGVPIWAHLAIIPPNDRTYPWLPKSFLPTHGIATA